MAKAKKRKFVDWDSIEPLYRAGGLSLQKICDQYEADHINSQVWKKTVHHSAILKKAKAKNWTRNLASKVQERIKEKLVTGLVTDCDLTEEQIVDKVSESGKEVVLNHRKDIAEIREHESILLKELKTGTKQILVDGELDDIKIDLKDRSIILKNIKDCRKDRIALERQAYNIDSDLTIDRQKALPLLRDVSKEEMIRIYQDAVKS